MSPTILAERSARDHETVQKVIIDHLTSSHAELLRARRRLEALLGHPEFKLQWKGQPVTSAEGLTAVLSAEGAEGDFPPQ
jgi:hypothetical protein